jgi:flavin reductase (DIM6/NTAB) family NADH-FMN oxidoreductase RutF
MNLDAKRKLLQFIPSGLFVIGIEAEGKTHAFTASWISQASMKPPCIMFGVRSPSYSLEILRKSKGFTVNYLSQKEPNIAEHFFKPEKTGKNRLNDFNHHPGKTGAPILENAIGHLECGIKNIVDGFGDHAVVIAEVMEAHLKKDTKPLVMADTKWKYGG